MIGFIWQRSQRTFLAAALAISIAPPATAQTILKFSHTDNPLGSRQKAAEAFGKKVEEYTRGKYKVQIYPSGQLANDPKAIEQLQNGGIDFTVSATGSYAGLQKTLNLTALPYLVETYEQGWALYDKSPWLKAQFEELPKKGIRILATFEAGFRSFTTKEPLKSPADAVGKKMRVYPNDMIRWIVDSIGFNPVVLPVTEVYLAIQQNLVVGQENPIDTIYSLRFYEVAPNITLTRHVYSPLPLAVSEKTWSRFSEEDRAAITKAAVEAADYSRKLVRDDEDSQLSEMTKKGAKVATPDLAPFHEAVKSVYDRAKEVYGNEAVEGILAAAKEIKASIPAK
jgi:tripartite ATP-independent transporter DctP family solute receptor